MRVLGYAFMSGTMLLAAAGCGSSQKFQLPDGTVWGGPSHDAIFAPYSGTWRWQKRTDESDADGTISGGADIRIDGHIITEITFMGSTRRLFDAHLHDGRLCAKAWDHEDPHDPGDFSKVHLTLAVEGDTLTIREQRATRQVDLDDPDLMRARDLVRKQGCGLESDVDYAWAPWVTLEYTRIK